MRIIGGRLKGRPIAAPKGHALRPTSDLVKETLFNMIGPQIHAAQALDLFAGTGNVGIEAFSRGAARVVFVEKDPRHVRCLRENLLACRLGEQADVYHGDANTVLATLGRQQHRFDLAFVDPPYRQTNLLTDILARLADCGPMAESGLIVVEHARAFTPPDEPGGGFSLTKQRRIGDTTLSFYQQRS